jgi:hypothetical protein
MFSEGKRESFETLVIYGEQTGVNHDADQFSFRLRRGLIRVPASVISHALRRPCAASTG